MSNLVFYSPSTFETQMDSLVDSEGTYVPNFRASSETSLQGDLVFDSTGFSKAIVFSGSLVKDSSEDFFYYRRPGKLLNNGVSGGYQYIQHPIHNRLFRHIPIHSIMSLEPLPPLGRGADVHIITTSSNWIKVNGNSIVEFSPSINQAIEAWKLKNKNKTITNESFFGVKPIAFPVSLNGGVYSISNAFEVDLVGKTITGNTDNYTFFVLGALDNLIANPVVTNTEHYGRYVVQDRGLTEYGVAPSKPVVAPPAASVTRADNYMISGTSNKPGWYVTMILSSLGLRSTIQTSTIDGSWFYRLSNDERSYLEENKIQVSSYTDQIQLIVHEKSNPASSSEEEKEVDQDVIKVNGIPKYVLIKGDNRFVSTISSETYNHVTSSAVNDHWYCFGVKATFYKYNKEYFKDKTGNLPLVEVIKRSSTINEDINKIYTGAYVGIGPGDENKFFVSFPGSIITSCGVDIFIKTTERGILDPVTPDPDFPINFVNTYKHAISLTCSVYGSETENQTIRIGWGRDEFLRESQRYQLRWRANLPANQDSYSLKWTKGYEPRAYRDNYRLKWSKENSSISKDEYSLRWGLELPSEDEDKMFFDMSWSREGTSDETMRYTIKYGVEMTKTMRDNYYMSWVRAPLEEVVTKIFCIKDGDRYHISYMVYGSKEVSEYILDDTITFYFSNPSKYELIKFNRDAEPYKDIVIKEFKGEKALASRAGIPEDYTLVGNYTILDIDIKNSLSLDVVAEGKQLNEFISYWLPENIEDLDPLFVPMSNKMLAAPVEPIFRDDHHIDAVELEIEFINEVECCFKQKSIGSRCSPY